MYIPFDTNKPLELYSNQIEAAAKEKMNKEILGLNGVRVEQFTRDKAISDLKEFFEWFCPQIKDWNIDYAAVNVFHEFQPMGKKSVPKNVVKIAFFYDIDRFNAEKAFDIYFSYLADGRINSIDANFRVQYSAIQLKVRLKKDELVITEIKTRNETGSKVVFKDNSPTDNVTSSLLLDTWWGMLPQPRSDDAAASECPTVYVTFEDHDYEENDTSSQQQAKSDKNEDSTVMGCIGMMIGLLAIMVGIFSCTSCIG